MRRAWLLAALVVAACSRHPSSAEPTAAGALPAVAGAEALFFQAPQSTIDFVGSKRTLSHEGRFTRFTGQMQFVPTDIGRSRISVSIATGSLLTPIAQLTAHLRSPDFFDAEHFGAATFVWTSIRPEGSGTNKYVVTGTVELRGTAHQVTFPASVTVTPGEVYATARFALSRRMFGVSPARRDAGAAPPPPPSATPPSPIEDLAVVRLVIHAPRPHVVGG